MTTNNNPLLCDPETGICEIPGVANTTDNQKINAVNKPVKIIYFTDPICSSCWGIEPQLRRLKLEYGHDVEIEYHMGGLLPDWSYNSGGISKPSDVAHHWDEVSLHYQMPIDGDVWLEDPLDSSYPPSIAFKAAQLQDEKKAIVFLRNMREMVFLQKKNITKWEVLKQAAIKAGLDSEKLKQDYEGIGKELFQADLSLAKKMGVRGFPSIFVTNSAGDSEFIYGTKPYSAYETWINKIYPKTVKITYAKDWESLFHKYPTLTLREFSELAEVSFKEAEKTLEKLVAENKLKKFTTKNGAIWIKQ
ncbi:ClpXP adapter SpxH family protein [Emticicia fontis]